MGTSRFRFLLQVCAEDEAKYREAWKTVEEADGVVIPGGFGLRGVEGKIAAAKYCRVNRTPFLGICLGMQVRPSSVKELPLRLWPATWLPVYRWPRERGMFVGQWVEHVLGLLA